MSLSRPWIQLYTRDWLDNKELRIRCSPLARSVLIDLMCLASEGARHGYLEDKMGPLTEAYLAARCHVTVKQLRTAVEELVRSERIHAAGGVYFIKRMVEDERIRQSRAAGGHKGGNPKLKGKDNLSANHFGDRKVIHPFDSDIDSENEFELEPEEENSEDEDLGFSKLQQIWFEKEFWPNYWRKVSKSKALKAFKKQATSEKAKNEILAGLEAHTAYYLNREPEHRPHASTWLNEQRFLEPAEDAPPRVQAGGESLEDRIARL